MSSTSFQIVYDGPALTQHEMSARELSSALLAFDDLFRESSNILNKGRTSNTLDVKASFQSGSFKIAFSSKSSLLDKFKDLLLSEEAAAIISAGDLLILLFGSAGLVPLVVWLKGRKITRLVMEPEGYVKVFVGDKYERFERRAIELFREHQIQKALNEAIAEPLKREGVDDFGVIFKNEVILSVSKPEAESFEPKSNEDLQLDDTERECFLFIVSPSFQKGDKWRVNDGGANFYVDIKDSDFLENIIKNEIELGAATTLKVRLREVTWRDGEGKLSKDNTIVEVLDIHKPDEQMEFPEIELGDNPKG